MYYRVEIQREDGRRRAAPLVVYGQLNSYTRAIGTRSLVMLQLTDTGSVHNIPKLYNPTVTKATYEGLQFSGLELTRDDAWVAQSWWCVFTTAEEAMAAQGSSKPRR